MGYFLRKSTVLLGNPVIGISGGIPVMIQGSLLLKTGREQHGVLRQRRSAEDHRPPAVISVTTISIGLILILSVLVLVLVTSISVAAAASSTTILHSLDLANCRIKRASAGRCNHRARQNTVSHTSGIGAHTPMLVLVYF